MENILKKVTAVNTPNLNIQMVIQVQEVFRTINRQDQRRTSPWYIYIYIYIYIEKNTWTPKSILFNDQ
jgi:hypothetical protein